MAQQSFIFGGNTGQTYADLKRMRERAKQLGRPMRVSGGIQGFGDGLSALGHALAYKLTTKKADALEAKGRDEFKKQFATLLGNRSNNAKTAMSPDALASSLGADSASLYQTPEQLSMQAGSNLAQMQPQQDLNNWAQPSTQQMPMQSANNSMQNKVDFDLANLAYSPFASQGQKAVLQLMLKKQIEDSMPPDELKRLQLEKMKLENQLKQKQLGESKIIKGADGFNYDAGTGERVLPDVEQEPELTSSMREYQMAVGQGFNGTFQDWAHGMKRAGASNVNVNTGNNPNIPEYSKLPQGHVYVRNPDGEVIFDENGVPKIAPIHGSPADIKARNQESANRAMDDYLRNSSGLVVEEIDRALGEIHEHSDDLISLNGTGMTGRIFRDMPASDAYTLNNMIDTIKANVGFDKLQQMRDASPTGGALGQVSEREMDFLQKVMGSLDIAQDEETLVYNLRRIKDFYQDILGRLDAESGQGASSQSGQTVKPKKARDWREAFKDYLD